MAKVKSMLPFQYLIQEPQDENLAVLFQCLYNFHSRMCLMPFRIVTDSPWMISVVQRGKFQKVLSILIWSLILLQSTIWIRQYVKGPVDNESSHNKFRSVEISNNANELSGYFQIIGLFQLAWCRTEHLELFLNLLRHYRCKNAFIKGVAFVIVMELLYIGASICRFMRSLIDFHDLVESLKPIVSFTFMGFYPSDEDFVSRQLISAIYILGTTFMEWYVSSLDLFLLLCALCLDKIGYQFELLSADDNTSDTEVVEEFSRIRNLSEISSGLLGDSILLNYFAIIGFYCYLLNKGILAPGGPYFQNLLSAFPYVPVNVATWWCFARFNSKVGYAIRNWIHRRGNSARISQRTFLILLSEVQAFRIGFSCRFFTVTYGFIGSMIGLILTYSIIMNQQT